MILPLEEGKVLETTSREGALLEALQAMRAALEAADPTKVTAAEQRLTAVADAGIRAADLRPPVTRRAREDIQALLQAPGANGTAPLIARVHELFEAAFNDKGAAPRSEVLRVADARVTGIGVELNRPGNDLLVAALTGNAEAAKMPREDLLAYFQGKLGSDFHLAEDIAEAARMLALDPHFHRSDVSRWSRTIKSDLANFLEARMRETQAQRRQETAQNAAQRAFADFLKEHAILPAVLETLRTGNLKVLSNRFPQFAFFQGLETFDEENPAETRKLKAGDSLRHIRQITADALHVEPAKVPRTPEELQKLHLSTSVLTLVAERIAEGLSETIPDEDAGPKIPLRLRKSWEYKRFLEALRVKREQFGAVAKPELREKLEHPDAFLLDLKPEIATMKQREGIAALRDVIEQLSGNLTPPPKRSAKPRRSISHQGPRGSFERLQAIKDEHATGDTKTA